MARVVLDGVARDVVVERTADGMFVSVDGRRYAVSDVIPLARAVGFLVGDTSQVAYVSTDATGTRISLNGCTYHRTDARLDADQLSRGGGGAHDGRVEAPMPGGIIALHVREGDTVKTGDPILVLESMKMHNEITAPVDGVVQRLDCKVGDQVSFGHVLAVIGTE